MAETLPDEIETVEWETFLSDYFRWRQGEHVAAIGPTNSGKTTLIMELIPLRRYVTFIATKPRDASAARLVKEDGFYRIEKWEKLDPTLYPKRLLWPPIKKLDQVVQQRNEILRALKAIYGEGRWCVVIDELWYIVQQLGLEKTVKTFFTQGRSLGISIVVGTQRPAFVPLEIYDQSTHLFFWRDNDERNLRRLSGVAWLSARKIMNLIANLPEHYVLYINTRTGQMVVTCAPFNPTKAAA